jgi:peroxin-7
MQGRHDLQFAGYSVCSSPFEAGQWAVATAANFGIVGNGRLQVVQAVPSPDGQIALQVRHRLLVC